MSESVFMMPMVLVCFFIRGFNYSFSQDSQEGPTTFKEAVVVLLSNWIYVSIVLGYAAQTFVTGAFGFYGIQYVQKRLNISNDVAGMSFGGLTAICGLFGTGFGGWLLDRTRRNHASYPRTVNKEANDESPDNDEAIETALRIVFALSFCAFPLCLLPFLNLFSGPVAFFVFIGMGEFLLFACFAPINSAILWSVPFRYSGLAVALSAVGLHVLGDAISPPILGKLLDRTSDNWNLSMFLIALWLGWSVLFFCFGWRLSKRNVAAIMEPLIETNVDTNKQQSPFKVLKTKSTSRRPNAQSEPRRSPTGEPSSFDDTASQ